MSTLRTLDLTKSYGGRTVVRGVNLEVASGEIVGLLGPNGAGKTTTFYMTVGLTAPDSGRVELDGHDVTDDPMYVRARKGIGYLPQEPSIFRGLTVEQNILAILETMDLDARDAPRAAARAARRAEPDAAGAARRPTRCRAASGGGPRSRGRSSSRRSSSCSTSRSPASIRSRSPTSRRSSFTCRDRGIGVLITDHNVRETLRITDRAYIVHGGVIFKSGTPDEPGGRRGGAPDLSGDRVPVGLK